MRNKLREKLKERKGFTLIEMMIVVAVIAILTGLVSVGIYGYMTSAYMIRVNDTAKTVFLASQNYLTEQKQLGKLEEFNEIAESYGGAVSEEELKNILLTNDSSFDFAAYKDKYGTDTVRYIALSAGEGATASENPIYTIVKRYMNEDDLLGHTFFMEYDTKTGVVRSVFYTEKANSLSYNGDLADKSNVILRDSDTLRDKRQGYYGVESTSLKETAENITVFAPKNVRLVNGERLYAQWQESNYLSPEERRNGYVTGANDDFNDVSLRQYLVYDVSVYRMNGSDEELLFTVSGLNPDMAKGSTITAADVAAGDGVRLSYNSDTNVCQLILDDIDHSIYETYGTGSTDPRVVVEEQIKAEDMIFCRVSERLDGHAYLTGESGGVSTNYQSANFAGGAEEFSYSGAEEDNVEVYGNGNLSEDGSEAVYGKAFSIANARHLNNMRYAKGTSCFIQTADIDWTRPESDRPTVTTLFEPLTFETDAGQALAGHAVSERAFSGTFLNGYQTGDDYIISHLNIEKLSGSAPEKNVGMFRHNTGTIEGIHIKDSEVKGAYLTGIICGTNSGEIKDVVIEECDVTAAYYAGGITGYNYSSGKLTDCQVDAAVATVLNTDIAIAKTALENDDIPDYGWYVGGAAGVNKGVLTNVTTGEETIAGVCNVGGLVGVNAVSESTSSDTTGIVEKSVNKNCVRTLKGTNGKPVDTLTYQNFGGIAGYNGDDSDVEACESAALVFMEQDSQTPDYVANIGGIAGYNEGTLAASKYTSGRVQAKTVEALTNECFTAAEQGTLPVYSGVNVGGIAGYNDEKGTIIACGSGNAVLGYRNVGGIAGSNAGILTYQDSFSGKWSNVSEQSRNVTGLVVATDYSAGGIVGTNEKEDIGGFFGIGSTPALVGYKNYANIFAGSLAGGIAGANGANGAYQFAADKTVDSENYYTTLVNLTQKSSDGSMSPVFENTNVTNMTISKCENNGFVYALNRYAGGITGINIGNIKNCGNMVSVSENAYLTAERMEKIAKADCVGGIAGANFGNITGGMEYTTLSVAVTGCDFTGGVAGMNRGNIQNMPTVSGDVIASGYAAGGVIGLNQSTSSMKQVAMTAGMQVKCGYFAGGIIGINIAENDTDTVINGLRTNKSETRRGTVTADAYAGGILGYNTTLSNGEDIGTLFGSTGEITTLRVHAFDTYQPGETVLVPETARKTIFKNCYNETEVYADRYLGGIVGYNGEDSPLYILDSNNYGKVAVVDQNKTKDGYYFVGGITGRNSSAGVIHGCINDGSVESPSKYLGGICEVNEGYIQFCTVGKSENYNTEGISGENSVGGLVGLNNNYIVQCTVSQFAKIRGGDNTGGIVGTNGKNGIVTGDANKAKKVEGSQAGSSTSSVCESSGAVYGNNNTGGIAGLNEGQLELVSVGAKASVSGNTYVGGLIGANTGTITQKESTDADENILQDLSNYATVTGNSAVGGIVGKHNSDKIKSCKNYGVVSCVKEYGTAGGITGSVGTKDGKAIVVTDCENYGKVTGGEYYKSCAGGITGKNTGKIEKCTNYGMAESGQGQAGGIAGNNNGILEDCVNYGSVSGASIVNDAVAIGGVVGYNDLKGSVIECASKSNKESSKVNLTQNVITGGGTVGGLVGFNMGTLNNTGDNLVVTVPITMSKTVSGLCRIGGIVGRQSVIGGEITYKDYEYAGTINISAAGVHAVGGIVGQLEYTMTLEDCKFTGKITGIGNSTDGYGGGVGGLAGVSKGTILITAKNGVASAVSEDAVVEGAFNVGGLVGNSIQVSFGGNTYSHILLIQTPTEKVKLEKLAVNNDDTTDNDVYYVNQATVIGVTRVGGVYGSVQDYADGDTCISPTTNNKKAVISHYKNQGQVKPNETIYMGNVREAIGGVIGSTNLSSSELELSDLYNEGTIGNEANEKYYATRSVRRIGGVIGTCGNNKRVDIVRCYNSGRISCGESYVGGIVGRIMDQPWRNTMTDCANSGEIVSNANYTGGLVGYVYRLDMNGVTNTGNITIKNTEVGSVGGIVGAVVDGNAVKNSAKDGIKVTNALNSGEIYITRTGLKTTKPIGGIIGSLQGDAVIQSCTNTGTISCVSDGRVGGILGYARGNYVTIVDCVNSGEIHAQESTGGILGEVARTPVFCFENNENSGDMHVKWRSGGLIGKADTIYTAWRRPAGWTLKNCVNRGNIYPKVQGIVGSTAAHEIGGCIGYLHTEETVESFVNEGQIILKDSVADNGQKLKNIQDIGGVVGRVTGIEGENPDLYKCVNRGSIWMEAGTKAVIPGTFTISYTTYTGGIGGIAGTVEKDGAWILSCENYGEVSLTEGNTVINVGGVAGVVATDAKLQYCNNYESVKASTEKTSENIGGIAGNCSGLIYACQTKKPQGSQKEVTGRLRVGGIVGNADNVTAKISSLVNEDSSAVTLIQNEFNITGKLAGGIVGKQMGATIGGAVNCANTTVTLILDANDSERNAAGGIVGYSHKYMEEGRTNGVIVNCYNFGQVRFAGSGQNHYLGGIIGYRHHMNQNFDLKTGTAVKDSFYLQSEIYNNIDTSQPDANIKRAVLAIGNEPGPNGNYLCDTGDQMFASATVEELQTEERFLWTEDAYRQMYQVVHSGEEPESTADWADSDTVMTDIVEPYDQYKLPVPKTNEVRAGDAYNYILDIAVTPGFCETIELYLFPEGETEITEENAIFGPQIEEVTIDGKVEDIAFNVENLKEYIGRPLQVAIKATGVTEQLEDGTEVVYSIDSDLKVVEEFIVMPPLVQPEIAAVSQLGPEVTFQITNWAEYQKSAKEIYDMLPDEVKDKEIYQKLINGVKRFQIYDYYVENQSITLAQAQNNSNTVKDVWYLNLDQINGDGTFVVDYSEKTNFQNNKSKLQWHIWKAQACALHTDWSVDAEKVLSSVYGYDYRYTSSVWNSMDIFQIKEKVPLDPPTDLKYAYAGDIDVDSTTTPYGYDISFKRSTSLEEVIAGYQIVVTNPANGKTYTTLYTPEPLPEVEEGGEEPDLTCTYSIPKEALLGTGDNQLALDLAPGTQPTTLQFTVQTIAGDTEVAKYFEDSKKELQYIYLIKKGAKVDDTLIVTIPNQAYPDQWKFSWEDPNYSSGNVYLVTYRVLSGETEVVPATTVETSNAWIEKDMTGRAKGEIIEISVVRKGAKNQNGVITRLNSDTVDYRKVIGEKLTDVTDVNTSFVRMDGENMIYNVTFNIPSELAGGVCNGFSIRQVTVDQNAVQLGEEITVPFNCEQPIEVSVPLDQGKGKNFYTIVTALSTLDASANSEGANGNTVKIPEARLAAPSEIKAGVNVFEEDGSTLKYAYELTEVPQDATYSFLAEEFAGMTYQLTWKATAQENTIAKQQLMVLAPDGTTVLLDTYTNKVAESYSWQADLSSYAGCDLTLKIWNLPSDTMNSLSSDPAEVTIHVPKIRLKSPQFAEGTPEAPVQNVTVTKADGTPIADTDAFTEDTYKTLRYTVNWTAPELTAEQKETGVKLRLVQVETDVATGEETLTAVDEFALVNAAGEEVPVLVAEDGTRIVDWANAFAANPDGTAGTAGSLTLTNLSPDFMGKNLRIYISHTPDTIDWQTSTQTEDATWADSYEATTEFVMPQMTLTASYSIQSVEIKQRATRQQEAEIEFEAGIELEIESLKKGDRTLER